jgi:coproporphyrinogen III oxidase-like Fe-S oxidoreductase
VGAVSTIAGRRRRNAPGLEAYVAALSEGREPPRTTEGLDADARRRERWMLGLRLERGLRMDWAGPPDHPAALPRLEAAGLLVRDGELLSLTRRGRFVQNAVLHELMEYA